MELLTTLKKLLGITTDDKDEILTFVLEAVTQAVKNYCWIDELPEELDPLVLSMSVDYYRAQEPGKETADGVLKSISEGDVSMSFQTEGTAGEEAGLSLLRGYEQQLARFRKPGW